MSFSCFLSLILLLTACGGQAAKTRTINAEKAPATVPAFDAQRAYAFVKAQTDFGPRVPGSEAHKACAAYLSQTLSGFGAQVTKQDFTAKGYDGTPWEGKNIIGSYLPQSKDRILLCAHWDSRFMAEHDVDEALQKQAIDGANDGASGVGVLLEIARLLQIQAPKVGVDIVFFDVEDQGAPYYESSPTTEDSWCLGSQHWAKEAVKSGYKARWGILLDMVGAADAVFMKEQISMHYAGQLVDYVWDKALDLGYGDLFLQQKGGLLTDDHLYVNRIAHIPCIDIIDYSDARGGFNATWHTHEDHINNISINTLKAVGTVVLTVVYEQ